MYFFFSMQTRGRGVEDQEIMKSTWRLAMRFASAESKDVLSATTDFGLFFSDANFFQFDHMSN